MSDVNTQDETMKREVAGRMGDAFAPILEGGMDPVAAAAEVRARLKASRLALPRAGGPRREPCRPGTRR
ncbi:hypothetical protein ACNQRH_01240 [Mycolicibacterium peregrinum]|uniref:hypothetical protein n=1 Tax=Mycolicibacterium peregrinum TaxID=43304 RepID=UPI003AAC6D91